MGKAALVPGLVKDHYLGQGAMLACVRAQTGNAHS